MTAHILIEKFRHAGIGFELSASGLKIVAAPGAVSPDLLAEIRANKTALLAALTNDAGMDDTCAQKGGDYIESVIVHPHAEAEQSSPKIRGCFDCGYYDGKGSAWPGVCRYFETVGQTAKEIDFNKVDPLHGCGFYAVRQNTHDFCFNDSPFEESGSPSCDDKPVARPITCREKISPVALEWLREQRQALKVAGWTMAELYRRNKSRGIAWARVWDKMGMTATLQGEVITITFDDNGRTIKQTARPRGTVERRQEMFDGLHRLIGKLLTVRYQELSEDGIPIFPVGVAVRDYE